MDPMPKNASALWLVKEYLPGLMPPPAAAAAAASVRDPQKTIAKTGRRRRRNMTRLPWKTTSPLVERAQPAPGEALITSLV